MNTDLDMAGWMALTDREARLVAERIARAVDARLVLLLPHAYRGRSVRLALFDRGEVLYSLIPGGEVRVGFDCERFTMPPQLAADHAADVVRARSAAAAEGFEFEPPEAVELIARSTTPTRTVSVPPLLVAVSAFEAGVSPCSPDHPDIERLLDDMRRIGQSPRRVEWHDRARAELSPDGTVARSWLIDRPTYDDAVADLATRGERLLTPDEWEHACGGSAPTLWRWGDEIPRDTLPIPDDDGPHQEPNLFGLTIGNNPYQAERTADRWTMRGGDGGTALHHSDGIALADWLTVATAFHDPRYSRFVVENHDQAKWIRPTIPVALP